MDKIYYFKNNTLGFVLRYCLHKAGVAFVSNNISMSNRDLSSYIEGDKVSGELGRMFCFGGGFDFYNGVNLVIIDDCINDIIHTLTSHLSSFNIRVITHTSNNVKLGFKDPMLIKYTYKDYWMLLQNLSPKLKSIPHIILNKTNFMHLDKCIATAMCYLNVLFNKDMNFKKEVFLRRFFLSLVSLYDSEYDVDKTNEDYIKDIKNVMGVELPNVCFDNSYVLDKLSSLDSTSSSIEEYNRLLDLCF